MSTARSSAEPPGIGQVLSEGLRSAADVRALFGFRLAGLRGRSRRAAPIALAVMCLVTLAVAVVPAFLPDQAFSRSDASLLLPSAFLSALVISVVSAATSGGGRELLPREQAVAFPVSATTDHLGALLMAPLNIAWLLQCWVVLGATSYAVGAHPLLIAALLPVVVWLAAATSIAQVLAWGVEWLRRGPHGTLVVRGGALLLLAGAATLVATHSLTPLLDRSPTVRIAVGVIDGAEGRWWSWLRVTAFLLVLGAGAVVLGAWAAGEVTRRPARDELRLESSQHAARPRSSSDLAALLRIDRASIWRSVPMRRGMLVLALFPGLVAMAGSFKWDMLAIFPGLVASGGALLFGVNAWCLDGRGALWRDSLPASPLLAFCSRVLVLLEVLVVSSLVTLLLASLRAGRPTSSQLVAVLCATVVVSVQVVATAMRWSVRRPYAVNLRSARATPAPPLVMVGYSSRLALTTTVTGLTFNATSQGPWPWSLVMAVPFLVWSGLKLRVAARAWSDPVTRARVIATVAV